MGPGRGAEPDDYKEREGHLVSQLHGALMRVHPVDAEGANDQRGQGIGELCDVVSHLKL